MILDDQYGQCNYQCSLWWHRRIMEKAILELRRPLDTLVDFGMRSCIEPDLGWIYLEWADDGRGCCAKTAHRGFGFRLMEYWFITFVMNCNFRNFGWAVTDSISQRCGQRDPLLNTWSNKAITFWGEVPFVGNSCSSFAKDPTLQHFFFRQVELCFIGYIALLLLLLWLLWYTSALASYNSPLISITIR